MEAGPAACPAQRQRADSARKETGTSCCGGFSWSRRASGTRRLSPPPQASQIRNLKKSRRTTQVKGLSNFFQSKLLFKPCKQTIKCGAKLNPLSLGNLRFNTSFSNRVELLTISICLPSLFKKLGMNPPRWQAVTHSCMSADAITLGLR